LLSTIEISSREWPLGYARGNVSAEHQLPRPERSQWAKGREQ